MILEVLRSEVQLPVSNAILWGSRVGPLNNDLKVELTTHLLPFLSGIDGLISCRRRLTNPHSEHRG
jgi:hypothetical protein